MFTEAQLTPACTEGMYVCSYCLANTCISLKLLPAATDCFVFHVMEGISACFFLVSGALTDNPIGWFSTRYLYTDLYSSLMWTGTETPEGSGNYTSAVKPVSCSKTSPIACESTTGSTDPLLGYIFSFGEDNSRDVFVLASKGVYRVVRPSLCGYTCPAEKLPTGNGTTPGGPSSFAPATRLARSVAVALALILCVLLL